MESEKAYAEVGEAVYKVKIFILSKKVQIRIINSHLPWLKYFLLITLKSDIGSTDSCFCHTKLLFKRAGFTVKVVVNDFSPQ